MKKKLIIVLQLIVAIISLMAGLGVYLYFDPEMFMEHEAEVIGQEEIRENPSKYYGGKIAGEDIFRLTRKEEVKEIVWDYKSFAREGYSYATVETEEIIGTGIYAEAIWLDDYYILDDFYVSFSRDDESRAEPKSLKGLSIRAEAYKEYYLVKLPDSGYVVARFSSAYKQKVKEGKVTLPLGVVYANSEEVIACLEEICSVYGADPSYTLYMVDEEWGLENHPKFFLIRFGAAILVYFALGAGGFLVVEILSKWIGEGKKKIFK